jgi:hypothetical protein
MPRSRPRALSARLFVIGALGLWACAGHRPPPAGRQPAAPATADNLSADAASARDVVALFVAAEAAGNPAADTLLVPGADFLMTGVRVTTKPRLAGLNGPGQAAVDEANMGLAGNFAWVVVAYQFTGRTPDLAERARASFVLEKQRAGWRIRHVHSSMVARW